MYIPNANTRKPTSSLINLLLTLITPMMPDLLVEQGLRCSLLLLDFGRVSYFSFHSSTTISYVYFYKNILSAMYAESSFKYMFLLSQHSSYVC